MFIKLSRYISQIQQFSVCKLQPHETFWAKTGCFPKWGRVVKFAVECEYIGIGS